MSASPDAAPILARDLALNCPSCHEKITSDDLFEQLSSPSSLVQVQFSSNYSEQGVVDVALGMEAYASLRRPVERINSVLALPLGSGKFVTHAVAAGPTSLRIVTSQATNQGESEKIGDPVKVFWVVHGWLPEGGIPAWLEFLDSARVATLASNFRGTVLDSHAALDAFLTEHQSRLLRARGFPEASAEWLLGRISALEQRLGHLLAATDQMRLEERSPGLLKSLLSSAALRNRLIHKNLEQVSIEDAMGSLVAVMRLIRLLEPEAFWRAAFGYGGLPPTTTEPIETVVRAVAVRFGVPKGAVPTVTVSGACAAHLSVSNVSAEGFTLRHSDPLDHEWVYETAAEWNP